MSPLLMWQALASRPPVHLRGTHPTSGPNLKIFVFLFSIYFDQHCNIAVSTASRTPVSCYLLLRHPRYIQRALSMYYCSSEQDSHPTTYLPGQTPNWSQIAKTRWKKGRYFSWIWVSSCKLESCCQNQSRHGKMKLALQGKIMVWMKKRMLNR